MRTLLFTAAKRLLAGLLAGAMAPCQAFASDPASEQLREQQRTLRQLEQRQRLQQWQRRPRPDSDNDTSPTPSSPQACWPVSAIRVSGNRRVTSQALRAALQPALKPCMGVADINHLLKAITARYVAEGYPASRPYLARAPQAEAPLEIIIVEGFVESIELRGNLPLSLRGAFPDLLGQPLHLPALEQGLDQLNRLRAFELSADLRPGDAPGATQVLIDGQQVSKRWHLDSRFDNLGSAHTGRHRLNLGLGLDSPLGLNDDLRLSLLSTVLDAPGQVQGVNLYYSLPYGPWTFTLNASQARYRAPLPGTRHASHGTSSLAGLNVERLLWRNQQGMLSANLRLDHKRLVNRLGQQRLQQQSPTLTTLEAGLNLLWLEGGLWNGYLGIAQGLDGFGADSQPLGKRAPVPDFRKYRASLLHLRQGPAQRPWRWVSELNLQYSPSLLPAVEQLSLSEDHAVRGFRQHAVAGASGATWRNTLSYPLTAFPPVHIRPHLGLDLGWSRYAPGSDGQQLIGAALGAELSLPQARLRLDYQQPLHASDVPRSALEHGFWVLEGSLNF